MVSRITVLIPYVGDAVACGGLNSKASFASPQLPCRFHKDRFLFFVHAWLWLWNVVCCTCDEKLVGFISNVV
jgi:hypothetical protein